MAIESYTPANTEEELAIAEGDVRVNLWKLTKVTIYFWMYMNMWIERHLFAIPAEIMMFSVDAHNYIHSMRACIHSWWMCVRRVRMSRGGYWGSVSFFQL